MKTELTLDLLRRDGIARQLEHGERRRRFAAALPPLLAAELAELPDVERAELAARALDTWWPEAVQQAEGVQGEQWPEVLSALAIALTLLYGELPASVRQALEKDAELRGRYERDVQCYERYILIVDAQCQVARLCVGHPPAGQQDAKWSMLTGLEDPAVMRWIALPQRRFEGRSHTGMLALCALERREIMRLPTDRPFAATAELGPDGSLNSVDQLVEKKRGFGERFPHGVLLTAPPYPDTEEHWLAVLTDGEHSRKDGHDARQHHWTQRLRKEELAASCASWVCAGSLEEAAAKLPAYLSAPAITPLRAWDDTVVRDAAIMPLGIGSDYEDRQTLTELVSDDFLFNVCWSLQRQTAKRPRAWPLPATERIGNSTSRLGRLMQAQSRKTDRSAGTLLVQEEDLLASLSAETGAAMSRAAAKGPASEEEKVAAQGAVLYGGPGSGKSLWSQLVPRWFLRGPLGALGMAVRVGTRQLAETLAKAAERTSLLDALGQLDPEQAALLQRLAKQRRLFVVLDGLDEVGAVVLARLGRLLRDAKLPFLATTRDAHHALDSFPPYLRFRFKPLEHAAVETFLLAMDRHDLHQQLYLTEGSGPVRLRELSPVIKALIETPFTLSLLCRVVRADEKIAVLSHNELYARAFRSMLDRATGEHRLSADQADLVRRTVPRVLGELALGWLRSSAEYVMDETIVACLHQNDIRGMDEIRYQQALEHGNLLVPGDGRREFAHKTIAEWAAARALVMDIEEVAFKAGQERRSVNYAEIEIASIDRLLGKDTPLHSSPLRQSLLFFAAAARAPLALLLRAVAPETLTSDTVHTAFLYAQELAMQSRYTQPADARTAWATLVRHALFSRQDEPSDEPDWQRWPEEAEPAPLAQLSERLNEHLPVRRTELISLIARTPEQRAQIEQDTTCLLPFCTARQAAAFSFVLDGKDLKKLATTLSYFELWQVPVGRRILDPLLQQLAAQHEGETGATDRQEIEHCERSLYSFCVALRYVPPRSVLQQRLLRWPKHLEPALRRLVPVLIEAPNQELRDTCLGFLDTVSELRREKKPLLTQVWKHPERERIADELHARVKQRRGFDRYGMTPWSLFCKKAEGVGWKPCETTHHQSLSSDQDALCMQVLSLLKEQLDTRHFLRALATSLIGRPDFEARASELWTALPDDEMRARMVRAFVKGGRIPACVELDLACKLLEPGDFKRQSLFGSEHAAVLSEWAQRGRGRSRFFALWWQFGSRSDRAVDYWEPVLESRDDPELCDLVRTHMRTLYLSAEERARIFPDELRPEEALAIRVRTRTAGWEDALLNELLAHPEESYEHEEHLYELIKESGLSAAIPELRRRLKHATLHGYSALGKALLAMVPEPDPELVEDFLIALSPSRTIPDEICNRIEARHLPVLLRMPAPPHHEGPLLTRLRGLRDSGLEQITARMRELQNEQHRLKQQQQIFHESRDWKNESETKDRLSGIERWMILLERLACHWSCQREPTLEFLCDYIEREPCKSLKDDLASLLKSRLADRADGAEFLRRLLGHCEELVRKLSSTLLLERTQPSAHIDLLIEALEKHLAYVDDESSPHSLPAWQRTRQHAGAELRYGHTGELFKLLGKQLTAAHRSRVKGLAGHPHSFMRIQAANWSAKHGNTSWLPIVRTLIADPHPQVCAAALLAFEQLIALHGRKELLQTDRLAWTWLHHAELLHWLQKERKESPYSSSELHYSAREHAVLDLPVRVLLLRESMVTLAGVRALQNQLCDWFREAVQHWDEQAQSIERAPDAARTGWFTDAELLHLATDAFEPVRMVLHRIVARRRSPLAMQTVEQQLQHAELRERLIGAECLLYSGSGAHADLAHSIWQEALDANAKSHFHPRDLNAPLRFACDDLVRLARALCAATPEHLPLAKLVAMRIYDTYVSDDEGYQDLEVSNPVAVKHLIALIERHGLPAARSILAGLDVRGVRDSYEWAESVFLSQPEVARQLLPELRALAQKTQGFKTLYERLAQPTDTEQATRERQHLINTVLPPRSASGPDPGECPE